MRVRTETATEGLPVSATSQRRPPLSRSVCQPRYVIRSIFQSVIYVVAWRHAMFISEVTSQKRQCHVSLVPLSWWRTQWQICREPRPGRYYYIGLSGRKYAANQRPAFDPRKVTSWSPTCPVRCRLLVMERGIYLPIVVNFN